MTDLASHSRRAGPALRVLVETDPALAALSLWCDHRDGAATRTNGGVITYGPDFANLARHEQIGLAAHHILHVSLRHPARLTDLQSRLGAAFDAELYNLAADALVNQALVLSDYALPRPAVLLTDLLLDVLGQDLPPDVALSDWDVDRLYHALVKSTEGQGGKSGKVQTYVRERSFSPDIDPSPGGGDDLADEEAAARWRQHLARALEAGRKAGRGIGVFGHRIADVPEPRIPWEVILRRTLTQAVTVAPQPSTRRPSRRWIAGAAEATLAGTPTPGFEPGVRHLTDVPRIVVALDASGSIDNARLALFWAEVTSIARRMRAELHLLVFDDDIRHHDRIIPAQRTLALPVLPRGGGTAFVPVVQKALSLNAAALVVLTDLEGDPGPAPRGLTVIWAVSDAGPLQVPYGRLIDLLH